MKMNLFVIVSILAALSVNVAFTKPSKKNKNSELCRYREGSSYRGTVSRSSNGRKCLRWGRIYHSWGASQGIGDHNFCRNPDNSLMPWCFVRKRGGVRREFCDIPRCSTPAVRSTGTPATAPPFPVDTERTCGERSERRMNKIVGGSFTAIESHPWVSAIYYKQRTFLCGGSLISPCWVLTAAHCFFEEELTNTRHLSVYLGRTAINQTDVSREQRFTVEKLIMHEEFNASSFNNDIALLKIRNTNGGCAEKTPSARTVCLPPLHTKLPVGFTCSVAGFGRQMSTSWEYSKLLKQADVTLLSFTACKRAPDYESRMTENMFCAASPDWTADACQGDSGGPLVCEVSGRMFLFGVVSWGIGCASVNKPGVYTQVTNYNKWIAEKTGCTDYTKGLMYPPK